MRAQGQKIKKVYVESDYAPLKSVYLADASGFHIPDMDIAWDMANMFAHNIPESKEYMRKHAGKFLGDADPERYAKVVAESDALAKAYRDNGVYVIRNESGVIPKEQIEFSESWSGQKLVGTYAQAAWEVVGNCLINFWEVSAEMGVEFQAREAVVEFFKNDPSAKWMAMPFPVPTSWPDPGPRTSAGDIKIFSEKRIVWGIGVADPSDMTDLSKARSSGDEVPPKSSSAWSSRMVGRWILSTSIATIPTTSTVCWLLSRRPACPIPRARCGRRYPSGSKTGRSST